MAKKKISELPAGGALNGSEIVPIVQTGTTKRVTAQDIANLGNASGVEGSGTINYLSKFTASSTIGNSQVFDNGTSVGIGTATPSATYKLDIVGSVRATTIVKSGGTSSEYLKADGSVSTLTNPITGTGTTNYLPKFTGASALGNSIISDNGTIATISGQLIANAVDYHTLTVADGGAQLRLERTGSGAGLMYLGADSSGFRIFDSSFNTRFFVGNTGSVGIGTASPNGKLQVVNSITDYSPTLILTNTATNNGALVGLRMLPNNGASGLYIGIHSTGIENQNVFINQEKNADLLVLTNNTERMRIFSDGNIAINSTTNAGYKLDVNGTARVVGTSAGLRIESTSINQNAELLFASTATTWRIGQNIGTATDFEIYNGGTLFKMNTSGAATFSSSVTATSLINILGNDSQVVIGSDKGGGASLKYNSNGNLDITPRSGFNTIFTTGRVGIGTGSPSNKLVVKDGATYLEFGTGTNYADILAYNRDASAYKTLTLRGSDITFSPSDVEKIRITNDGQLAIGTTTPDASALVQIDSTTQGFLVPRMSEAEINSISSPAEGLMVYNTDQKHMCMYDGSGWKKFSMSNM